MAFLSTLPQVCRTLEIASFALSYFTEYRTLSDRVGRHATDFWTSYFDTWSDGAFRPIRLLNLPMSELPQVRVHRNIFFCTIRSQVTSGHFCSSSSPATIIDPCLPRVPSSDERRFENVHDKHQNGPTEIEDLFRATFRIEKVIRGWEHFKQSR